MSVTNTRIEADKLPTQAQNQSLIYIAKPLTSIRHLSIIRDLAACSVLEDQQIGYISRTTVSLCRCKPDIPYRPRT